MSSNTVINQITDDLVAVLYPNPSEDEKTQLAQVRQTIEGILTKHGVGRSAPAADNSQQAMLTMLQKMLSGSPTSTSTNNGRKGPKKGTVNCYHVYLKKYCDYPAWKEANPGQSYQAFQKAMGPSWETFKQDKTKHDALKALAAEQSAAKVSS